MALKAGTVKGNNLSSPRFSEIVGTVTSNNARKFGITSGVQRKLQQKKFGTQRSMENSNADFKVVEIEDGKKSVRPLTGLRRDSEVMYVKSFDKDESNTARRGKLSNVFETDSKRSSNASDDFLQNENDFGDDALLQEPASIFERPGFGNFAFRNSVSATLSALPVTLDEEEEEKEGRGDISSIGSAGSLAKRQGKTIGANSWNADVISDYEDDDDGSLNDEEWSPLQMFLVANGLGEYMGRFIAEKIDLESLVLLNDSDLKDIGLPLGPRKKLLLALENRKKALEQPGEVHDSQL